MYKYLTDAESLYKKLHNDTKKIKTDFISSALTISSIGDTIKEQNGKFSEFDSKVMEGKTLHA